MRLRARFAFICWALLCCCASAQFAHAAEEISIYVPPFDGPTGLSQSVNTILRLQIWQTLRKVAEQGTSAAESLGDGTVKWGPHNLPTLSYLAADAFAGHARILSQIVLFGTVQEYGSGAVVQAFLSIPEYKKINAQYFADFRTQRKELWTVGIRVSGGDVEFFQDVPRRRMAFEPVVLTKELISNYSDLNSIIMYKPTRPDERIGPVGDIIEAVEQQGELALVRSEGRIGVVRLPQLASHRSEIVDFASGLVRIFRGDWIGANELFARVIDNPNAPTDIRIDAHLYRAMANARLGRATADDIEGALGLNPYAVRSVQFAAMALITELKYSMESATGRGKSKALIRDIRRLIAEHRHLFLKEDPWLDHAVRGLDIIDHSF